MMDTESKLIHIFDSENRKYDIQKTIANNSLSGNRFVYLASDYSKLDFKIGNNLPNFTFISKMFLDQNKIQDVIKNDIETDFSTLNFFIKCNNKEIDNSLIQISLFLLNIISDIDKEILFNFGVVYREIVTNEIKYASKGDSDKVWIEIVVKISERLVLMQIDNEKSSFDLKSNCEKVAEINDLRTEQRGLYLIKKLSDEIIYHERKKIVKFKV